MNVTLEGTISLYEGIIVQNRKKVAMTQGGYPSELERRQRDLARDQLILGALKFAARHGYAGEE